MIRVRNWQDFQHYKDRSPVWIKLYTRLLSDPEWHELSGDDAKALIMIWLVASEDNGNLRSIKHLAFNLRRPESEVNATVSRLSHWLETVDDSAVLASGYQPDSPRALARGEERREEKRREELKKKNFIKEKNTTRSEIEPPEPDASVTPGLLSEWNEVLEAFRKEIPAAAFKSWFDGVGPVEMQGGEVTIGTPSAIGRNWVRTHYADRLATLWGEVNKSVYAVGVKVS